MANGLMLKHEVGQEINADVPSALVEVYPQLAGFVRVAGQQGLF